MKKLFISFLFFLTLIISTVSFANSNTTNFAANKSSYFDSNVYVEPDALKLNVAVDKEVGTHVQIKIIDPNGITILYHHLNAQETLTHTRLDLSALENGQYQLIISDDDNESVKDFEIKTSPSQSYRGIVLSMI